MQFVKCITFLTLLKVAYPHIEGFGRSKIIKNPDGTIKKIIYSSIEEYFAMAIFEQIKDSPKVSDEKVIIHNTLIGFLWEKLRKIQFYPSNNLLICNFLEMLSHGAMPKMGSLQGESGPEMFSGLFQHREGTNQCLQNCIS